MNGIILIEIQRFVNARLGHQDWHEFLRLAGVQPKVYEPRTDYPDQEALALLTTLGGKTGESVSAILEALGEFIVPDLMTMSKSFINPDWKTIDLIANTEATIHEALRRAGTSTNPPMLKCEKTSPQEVIVTYTSPRKMCFLAKGIAKGVAKHYQERISIREPTCMLKGGATCQLIIAVA